LPKIEEPLQETSQKRLEQYFFAGMHKFGNTQAEIILNLGKPKRTRTGGDLSKSNELTSEDKRLIRGHGPGVENEIAELAYQGLSIKVLKVNSPPYREFIYDIRVANNIYKMLWNLNVGCSRNEVRRILGDPTRCDESKDSYVVVHSDAKGDPVGYEDLVSFSYSDNAVSRILFWLNID
jgi:hypothetical protein